MIEIVPAILATSEEQFKEDLEKIESSPSLSEGWIHLDFTDNEFVSNKTVDPSILKTYPTDLSVEAHLMMTDPILAMDSLKVIGVKRAIAHVEVEKEKLLSFIKFCKDSEIEVGLAIKMNTPLTALDEYWNMINLVLVMAVEPGLQGNPFIPESLDRLKDVKSICTKMNKSIMIGVDGHINDLDVKSVVDAGAEHLVIGSYLLEGDIDENIEKIWQTLQS